MQYSMHFHIYIHVYIDMMILVIPCYTYAPLAMVIPRIAMGLSHAAAGYDLRSVLGMIQEESGLIIN